MNLAWTDTPDERTDRFPQGRCECGHDLAGASGLGVVDRYQQHEIPQVSVKVTQYDQHRVRCQCGRVHTADTGPQLCCQHLLRDLDGAAEVYPDAHWPTQIAEALRALIHETNLARDQGLEAIPAAVKNELITRFCDGVLVGLSATTTHGTRPGERKARLLLEVLRDRQADVLRFTHDLKVPPTSKPNATYGPARYSRTSPGGSPARTAPKTATRSAGSSPPLPSTVLT